MFITFEGIEGSGKSTQISQLTKWLTATNTPYISTREPGGTPLGVALRDLLLSPSSTIVSPVSELFLFSADRTEHLSQVVLPALQKKKWVICDRYTDSTFAYQVYGKGVDKGLINSVHKYILKNIKPDLTFVLTVNLSKAFKRLKKRKKKVKIQKLQNLKLAGVTR